MSATTGKALDGDAHIAQSIGRILSTPIGSCVMRRDFGSLLFQLIDQPLNPGTLMLLRAATADALRRWEPRVRLTRVQFTGDFAVGDATIHVEGARIPQGTRQPLLSLSIPLRRPLAAS